MKKILFLVMIFVSLNVSYASPYWSGEGTFIYLPPETSDKPGKDTVLSFAGDVSFATYVAQRIEKYGEDYPFEKVKDIFLNDDISMINLETSITNRTTPANIKKEYNFKSKTDMAKVLKETSIDIVSLANNHVLDYGKSGFSDTLKHLRANSIATIGGGKNKSDASKLLIKEINGIKYGFLNYSRVVPHVSWYAKKDSPGILGSYDSQLDSVLKEVKSANEKTDILIVSMHWGKEPDENVRKEEIRAGRALVRAGADVVIGHHPHLIQGAELYEGGAIFYSLGNFVFPNMGGVSDKSAILQMKVNEKGERSFLFLPVVIKNSRPVILSGNEKARELERISKLCKPFGTYVDKDGVLRLK